MVGERLRAARAAKGLDLEYMAQATKLRASLIAALEAEDFEACGGDVYVRGHLRTIAGVLGLDPDQVIADYEASLPNER